MTIDFREPIICIGARQSGWRELALFFNRHRDGSFFGETGSLAPALWERLFRQYDLIMNCLVEWRNPAGVERSVAERIETDRLNRLVAEFVFRALKANPDKQFWGFAEPAMGSPAGASVDWSVYDRVFPRAKWVHVVRNPILSAASVPDRDAPAITRAQFESRLSDWVSVHRLNSERRETGRYFLARSEDLWSSTDEKRRDLLASLHIPWYGDCGTPFENNAEGTFDRTLWADPIRIDGLYAIAGDLDYLDELERMGVRLLDDRIPQ